MKLISVVVPVFNEEKNIAFLYRRVASVFHGFGTKFNWEIILINDGSSDKTGEELEKLARADKHVKYIEFSRNFGKEIATTAGIHNAKGDAVIAIDADCQHPPELIPKFIEKWKAGADIVIGVRENDADESWVRKIGAQLFYEIMNSIGETKIVPRGTDFRLVSRQVADEFNKFTEHNRMTRGLFDWLGFKRAYVYFKAPKRDGGEARYSFMKLVKLAMSTFVAHSLFPLKLAGYLGVVITFISGIFGLFIFVGKYILGDPWISTFSGSAILAVIILFLVGIILCCLGLIALYIANIQIEVVDRPMYVVRKKKL